jgi:hypothetical protein
MRPLPRFMSLVRNDRGNVLIAAAATMPLLLGSAGLAIDTVQLSLSKRELQRAADSGALAGAYARAQQKPVVPSVERSLQYNNNVSLTSTTIEPIPSTGPYANNPNAIRIVLRSQRALPFLSFFLNTPPSVSAEATAALVYQGQYCMISLEDANATGVTFSGNTTSNFGCGVVSNSRSASAVTANGSAVVTASPVAAVGGVPASAAYVQPTVLLPYSLPQADPYAHLPNPAPTNCSNQKLNVQPNAVVSDIAPGSCFSGWDIKGTLNLAPGTYYVRGDTLGVNATGVVTGNGVTIVLTSATPSSGTGFATVDIHGNAQINLSAPTTSSGQPFPGLILYQDRRAPAGVNNFINGNSSSSYEGGIYFPRQNLTFNGNTGMETRCLQLVGRRITFTGNSRVQNECTTAGGARAFDASWVRLVG